MAPYFIGLIVFHEFSKKSYLITYKNWPESENKCDFLGFSCNLWGELDLQFMSHCFSLLSETCSATILIISLSYKSVFKQKYQRLHEATSLSLLRTCCCSLSKHGIWWHHLYTESDILCKKHWTHLFLRCCRAGERWGQRRGWRQRVLWRHGRGSWVYHCTRRPPVPQVSALFTLHRHVLAHRKSYKEKPLKSEYPCASISDSSGWRYF